MPQLIIVSNRLPVTVKKVDDAITIYPSEGGLPTSLSSYIKKGNNKWIGWPGIASDDLTEAEQQYVTNELKKYKCIPVFLTKKQVNEYYYGYSNSILWPYFHNLPADRAHEERQWKAYKEVNALFADAVLALSRPESRIWVHDYLLALLPEYIRADRPAADIGFFLHIPFPKAKHFAKLPHARSLLKGLLGADLVGFHTTTYMDNFLDTCQELNLGTVSSTDIILPDRVARVSDFPIGIDYTKFFETSKSLAVRKEVLKLRSKYGRKKIILTVDRLDPSKGLVERAEAYQQFLAQNPRLHGKVVMIMLVVPSRTEIKAYQDVKQRLEKVVRETNKTYKTALWKPIDYMYTSVPFEKLSALYRLADVAFIAPLKDGMNLVAKEYVASKPNKNGVLILSETAGAAQELTEAIIVNPLRQTAVVDALTKSITMPKLELQKRIGNMQGYLSNHTVDNWAGTFMNSLTKDITVPRTHTLNPKMHRQIVQKFKKAKRRLLLLDYDGCLVPFNSRPELATPPQELKDLLMKLATLPNTDVVIVSGRSRANMQKWFRKLPVSLVAEHGAMMKLRDKQWQYLVKEPTAWKEVIRPALEKHATQTPLAFVEEKECSLVWHYRNASPYYAQKHLVILKKALKPFLKRYGLKVFSGNKILEVKSPLANKGLPVKTWLKKSYDFVLTFGDDYTDEDMFAVLPDTAYSVKVGTNKTKARFRVKSQPGVIELLEKLSGS